MRTRELPRAPRPLWLLLFVLASTLPAGTVAAGFTCPPGGTLCDFCPGSWVPKCCAKGQSCVPGFGCISPGYIPCSARCAQTAVACGCPAGASGACSVAPKCCQNNCCVAQFTQVGPDSSALREKAGNASTMNPVGNASANPSANANSTCVDAAWLERVSMGKHLVHRSAHPSAAVLCPGAGLPCGTPRHVVRVDGAHTTYADLCKQRACDNRFMPVNAVYTHRWNAKYSSTVPPVRIDGKLVELTMYSDVCDHRLQVLAHWGLEAVHQAHAALFSARVLSV
jgi:hypothetical protein